MNCYETFKSGAWNDTPLRVLKLLHMEKPSCTQLYFKSWISYKILVRHRKQRVGQLRRTHIAAIRFSPFEAEISNKGIFFFGKKSNICYENDQSSPVLQTGYGPHNTFNFGENWGINQLLTEPLPGVSTLLLVSGRWTDISMPISHHFLLWEHFCALGIQNIPWHQDPLTILNFGSAEQ